METRELAFRYQKLRGIVEYEWDEWDEWDIGGIELIELTNEIGAPIEDFELCEAALQRGREILETMGREGDDERWHHEQSLRTRERIEDLQADGYMEMERHGL